MERLRRLMTIKAQVLKVVASNNGVVRPKSMTADMIYLLEDIEANAVQQALLRNALDKALHALVTTNNLYATDMPHLLTGDQGQDDKIAWSIDNSAEIEIIEVAMEYRPTTREEANGTCISGKH